MTPNELAAIVAEVADGGLRGLCGFRSGTHAGPHPVRGHEHEPDFWEITRSIPMFVHDLRGAIETSVQTVVRIQVDTEALQWYFAWGSP